jgi:hypothetical protein
MKVRVNGRDYDAIFPASHSAVKGASDKRGGVYSNWVRHMYILWHGRDDWELIENLNKDYEWAKTGMGLFLVLAGLETHEVKAGKWAIRRVEWLKTNIPKYERDLEDMRDEYKKMTDSDI